MLIEPLMTQLETLGLRGMCRALERQQQSPEVEAQNHSSGWSVLRHCPRQRACDQCFRHPGPQSSSPRPYRRAGL